MMLLANLALALAWAWMTGRATLGNLLLGFGLGYLVLAVAGGWRRPYVHRLRTGAALAVFAAFELILANLRVAWYTVSSLRGLEPAILAVPLAPDLTDTELLLLATLVTLTPGTLSLNLSEDRRHLFVHFMHVGDADAAIANIKRGFERRILRMRA